MADGIKILETFRDAIQGLNTFIPTGTKIGIVRSMLEVGFDYLDAGSFVSSRLIPQFSDIDAVLDGIGDHTAGTKVFVLAGNTVGAKRGCQRREVDVVGFPFSTSETFLKKNINSDFQSAWSTIEDIQDECLQTGKELMVYLAMAFGNPYGDPVSTQVCMEMAERLYRMGVRTIHLSDIIGVATPEQIGEYYGLLSKEFPALNLGIHLHIKDDTWYNKLFQAWNNGCRIFDGVASGLGGCPMSGYEMLKNMPTMNIIEFAERNNITLKIDHTKFQQARILSTTNFLKNN